MVKKLSKLSENDKSVFLNVLGAYLVKGLALIVSLLSTPAYIQFFHDQTTLGLWFTINSLLSWILNFDLGIGNGLRNYLTKSYADKNADETRRYISSAYFSVGLLCVLICGVFVLVFDKVDWNAIFHIDAKVVSNDALLTTVKIVFLSVLLQLFFKLINSVLYAIQKSSVNNFISLCTSVITLICLYVVPSKDNNTNVILMAVVQLFAAIVPLLVATLLVFVKTDLKKAIPSIHYFSKSHAKNVLTLGGSFLFVQLVYMVIMNTNEYMINVFCSNEAVVTYQLYHKPFSFGGTLFTLALTPIWSAVTKAFAEKEVLWINKLYKKLMVFAAVGSVGSFLVIPFIQFFMDLWLGKNYLIVNGWYAVVFALLNTAMIFISVLSSFANGIGKLKTQLICFSVGAIVKVPIAYILVKIFESWIGVVLANVIAMGIYCVIQPIVIRKELIFGQEDMN